jgi:hypothetical protein
MALSILRWALANSFALISGEARAKRRLARLAMERIIVRSRNSSSAADAGAASTCCCAFKKS